MPAVLAHSGHHHGYGPSLGELGLVALVVVVLLGIWLAAVALQSRRHRSRSGAAGPRATRAPRTGGGEE